MIQCEAIIDYTRCELVEPCQRNRENRRNSIERIDNCKKSYHGSRSFVARMVYIQ